MNLKFKIHHNKKWLDISKTITDVEWSDSTDALGMDFSFKYPYNRQDPYYNFTFSLGDVFLIKDGKREIFRGIITQKSLNTGEYSGHDLAFYLNKSEVIIQFKKISASKAIRRLCEMYEVPVGTIPNMPTVIKKIYKDKTVADVIKDILKQVKNDTGKGHRIEMNKGKLNIMQTRYYKVDPYFTDADNQRKRCTTTLTASGDMSIEEMKNKIIVAGNNEKKRQVKAVVSSAKSIKRYGLLTEVITGDKMTAAKARNIAKNKLEAHNKISKNISLDMIGNPYIKAARKIYINRPDQGLRKGYYYIKSATQHYNKGILKTTIEMR